MTIITFTLASCIMRLFFRLIVLLLLIPIYMILLPFKLLFGMKTPEDRRLKAENRRLKERIKELEEWEAFEEEEEFYDDLDL